MCSIKWEKSKGPSQPNQSNIVFYSIQDICDIVEYYTYIDTSYSYMLTNSNEFTTLYGSLFN